MKRDFIGIIAIGVFCASILLSAALTDSAKAADTAQNASIHNGMHFDESSLVKGTGDVSIRGSFGDRAMSSYGWLKGTGSINLESIRSMSKRHKTVDFNQKSDLVFQGGQLISIKNLQSPFFYRGNGASVTEWSNLTHVDKSEIDAIRSINRLNNTLIFDTVMAFDGTWNIENQVGWGFGLKKSNQRYSGSFQTQKKIELCE